MVIGNMHIHSSYSWDSKMTLYRISEYLVKRNVKYGCILDHVEFGSEPAGYIVSKLYGRNQIIDELNEYNEGKLILLKGAEVSSPYRYKSEIKQLEKLELDLIVGSEHRIQRNETDINKIKDITKIYYESILKNIEVAQVDCIGHLDYIRRYYNNAEINQKQLKEIMQALKENNKIIELNTSGVRRNINSFFPNKEIIKEYKKNQSEIIIGSDAHKIDELTDNLEEAYDYCNIIGLEPVIYQKRKRIKL